MKAEKKPRKELEIDYIKITFKDGRVSETTVKLKSKAKKQR